jgi:hypothetical protein
MLKAYLIKASCCALKVSCLACNSAAAPYWDWMD